MTIGDVLAVVSLVGVIAAGWAALLLITALSFPTRTQAIADRIVARPGATALRGLLIVAITLIASLILRNLPGPGKPISWILLAGLTLTSAVGGGGIVRMVATRIGQTGTVLSPFEALTRASALTVLAGLIPVVGWAVVTPIAMALSVGGVHAAWAENRKTAREAGRKAVPTGCESVA